MNYVGKFVYTLFGNSLRFGSVIEESNNENWKFVRVDWKDDEKFQNDRERVIQLRGYDKYSNWYRVDTVTVFDPELMIETIEKIS